MSKLVIEHISKIIKKNEKDSCVICGMKTKYSKNCNINIRNYYVEGCGQLCKNCHANIYK